MYACRQDYFSTFAVIPPNGIWEEKAKCGWFGMSNETPQTATIWDDNFLIISSIASEYEMKGEYEKATKYYEQVCEKEPYEFNLYSLARICEKQGVKTRQLYVKY